MSIFNGKLKSFEDEKKVMKFVFENTNLNQLATDVEAFFTGEGYKLEKGTVEKGTYGIGNQTMRLLFGAFVKRYAFEFEILPDAEDASLTRFEFMKDSLNKISGGVIGYNKANKELKRLAEKVQAG